ncbi:MAG: hypothetical protein AAF648_12580, partial [Pseudomonadota bacterium]
MDDSKRATMKTGAALLLPALLSPVARNCRWLSVQAAIHRTTTGESWGKERRQQQSRSGLHRRSFAVVHSES